MTHIPVLLNDTVAALDVERAGIVVDCTYGGGGHSRAILEALAPEAQLISLDADETALLQNPSTDSRHITRCANFRDVAQVVKGVTDQPVDALLADLGWRTDQFESGGKGFSFAAEEPLSMTFGNPADYVFTAHEVVNEWDEVNIADIIWGYGEERGARLVAAAIVAARAQAPIASAAALSEVVTAAVGKYYRRSKIHPATKTFQAIRIAVNDELGALTALLEDGFKLLAPAGRFVIISFHSLEDRIVKQAFRSFVHDQQAVAITKKPMVASPTEVADNPKARSAKLRVIEKI